LEAYLDRIDFDGDSGSNNVVHMKKKYQIWVEGFIATGENGRAHLAGTYEAEEFSEACAMAAKGRNWGDLFNPERLTYWGCRLFPTEHEARVFNG